MVIKHENEFRETAIPSRCLTPLGSMNRNSCHQTFSNPANAAISGGIHEKTVDIVLFCHSCLVSERC